MKILFAGTPDFAAVSLAALVEQHDVVGVFTQPDRASGRGKKLTPPAVKRMAEQHGLPVYQPQRLGDDEIQLIKSMQLDTMVVVAYGMLLPQAILDLPRYGCLNVHASLLPRWRGAAPIQRAIEAGDAKTGVCIMSMQAGLDTGPVYTTLEVEINQQHTSTDLHHRLAELGAEGLLATLPELATAVPVEQDHAAATYAKKLSKSEAMIDWSDSAKQIQQRIRAFIEWPVCQTVHQGNRLRIRRASLVKHSLDSIRSIPGQVLDVEEKGIHVACGAGSIRLENLQRDGGKALPFGEFRNGYTVSIGDLLGSE